jgi:hypothetical protein
MISKGESYQRGKNMSFLKWQKRIKPIKQKMKDNTIANQTNLFFFTADICTSHRLPSSYWISTVNEIPNHNTILKGIFCDFQLEIFSVINKQSNFTIGDSFGVWPHSAILHTKTKTPSILKTQKYQKPVNCKGTACSQCKTKSIS